MIDDTTHTHGERGAHRAPRAGTVPGAWTTARAWLRSPGGLVTLGLFALALVGLAAQHPALLVAALPYTLFLACPLMMVFLHGGHGGRDGRNQTGGRS
jgi:hypothetical protein